MKKNFLWLSAALLWAALPVVSQPLTASTGQLTFGTVTETTPDSLSLSLSNPHPFPVTVTEMRFFSTYRQPAFSVQQPALTLAPGSTQTVWVRFEPQHNIAHNSELIIRTDSHLGSIRVDLLGQGEYSNTYYSTTQNLEEEALKLALRARISQGYNSLGYNTARDRMFMQIDNKRVNGEGATVNTLECVYTGRLAVGYTSRADAQNNHNFNTEHTYPQSLFNQAEPMRSDLHHLFPTDEAANNSRANYPFGVATQPYQNPAINSPSALGANLRYEPRDEHKGAAARAMLYFVVRYQDYQNYINSQYHILKEWNHTHQPTQVQRKRNDDIALPTNQNNRNPFVDYPQLADRISNFSATSVAPVQWQLYASDSIIDFGFPQLSQPVYRFVLVNHGNQPIDLSNFAISNPTHLSLQAGSGNVSLAPGEAHVIDIQLSGLGAGVGLSEQLTFSTNMPGQGTMVVPVVANGALGLGAGAGHRFMLQVFPNPASGAIRLTSDLADTEGATVLVVNQLGQLLQQVPYTASGQSIDISGLPAGMYTLLLHSLGGNAQQRFVKLGR